MSSGSAPSCPLPWTYLTGLYCFRKLSLFFRIMCPDISLPGWLSGLEKIGHSCPKPHHCREIVIFLGRQETECRQINITINTMNNYYKSSAWCSSLHGLPSVSIHSGQVSVHSVCLEALNPTYGQQLASAYNYWGTWPCAHMWFCMLDFTSDVCLHSKEG